MGKASIARGGRISKSAERARSGDITKAGGVPDANGKMGTFAMSGNENMTSKVVSVMRGQTGTGPKNAAGVARGGGQIGLAPGQIGAWAQPL